jgi:hypothetical protein
MYLMNEYAIFRVQPYSPRKRLWDERRAASHPIANENLSMLDELKVLSLFSE